MTNSFAEWPLHGHEVSILMALIGAVDWRCGIAPRSKTSMTIMRPPQHGHGGLPLSTMVSVGSSSRSLTASSSRACDIVGADAPVPASRNGGCGEGLLAARG